MYILLIMINRKELKEESLESIKVAGGCACFNLRKTTRVVTQLYDRIRRPSGLNGTQFTLLAAVAIIGAPTIAGLAKRLVMDRTTLTRNIKPLEKQGLLTSAAGEDQRTRIVTLTTKGRTSLLEAFPLWQKAQKSIIDQFGDNRWDSMKMDLSALISIAQAI